MVENFIDIFLPFQNKIVDNLHKKIVGSVVLMFYLDCHHVLANYKFASNIAQNILI